MVNEYLLKVYWNESYKKLGELFSNLKVPCACVKGEVLSLQAYGVEGKRRSTDIDLLVSRENLSDIFEELKKIGFKSTSSSRASEVTLMSCSHQISPWVYNMPIWGKIVLDLNFDVFWGEYEGEHIDIKEFLSDVVPIKIYGTTVKTLSIYKTIIHLALHHYKDMNSLYLLSTKNSIRVNMFEDIYNLIKNNESIINVERLYDICEQYKVIPYMYYILYYTGKIFNDELINKYIGVFKSAEGDFLLNKYGLCDKERKKWKCDFNTRLNSNDIYKLIESDLSENDKNKISFNKKIFLEEE